MFKASVIGFAVLVSGFMIWVGNHGPELAQHLNVRSDVPHVTLAG